MHSDSVIWQLHQLWPMDPLKGALVPPLGPLDQAAPLFQLLLDSIWLCPPLHSPPQRELSCWSMPKGMCSPDESRNDGYWGAKCLPPLCQGGIHISLAPFTSLALSGGPSRDQNSAEATAVCAPSLPCPILLPLFPYRFYPRLCF